MTAVAAAASAAALGSACLATPIIDPLDREDARDTAPKADGAEVDASSVDAGCDEPLSLPFRPSNLGLCIERNPPIALTVASSPDAENLYQIDTDADVFLIGPDVNSLPASRVVEQEGGPDILVIATESFVIAPGAELRVVGSRALAVIATGDIAIHGTLSAGALRAADGPGGDDGDACATGRGHDGVGQTVNDAMGGSGGGGGAFGDAGGGGAPVDEAVDAVATPAGEPSGSIDLVPLRGGCGGGHGGLAGGEGGGAGGALQLVAGGALVVGSDGTITARGGGGLGNHDSDPGGGGGGGGGSGGGVLLEAATIEIRGAVTANGGGGGSAAYSRDWEYITDGVDGRDRESGRAPGGDNNTLRDGKGGAGGSAEGLRGQDGLIGITDEPNSNVASGGGGGGGIGRIYLRAIDQAPDTKGGLVSPPASVSRFR